MTADDLLRRRWLRRRRARSLAAIDARRALLRPVRTSADELCADLATVVPDAERALLAEGQSAEHVEGFKRGFEKGANLSNLAESCASQVRLLAACDDQLALLGANFGHWTVDGGLRFDATVPAEVLAAYDRHIARIDAEAATMERLEQLRVAPPAPE